MGCCSSDLAAGAQPAQVRVGDVAPQFVVRSLNCGLVDAPALLSSGRHLVIVFYRGGWCPFCNRHLQSLNKRLQEIDTLGATLVAIAPEKPTGVDATASEYKLAYPVVSDGGCAISRSFGIVYEAAKGMQLLHDFSEINEYTDEDGNVVKAPQWLPTPATFIVEARTGIVRFAHVDAAGMVNRMSPDDIIAELSALEPPVREPTA